MLSFAMYGGNIYYFVCMSVIRSATCWFFAMTNILMLCLLSTSESSMQTQGLKACNMCVCAQPIRPAEFWYVPILKSTLGARLQQCATQQRLTCSLPPVGSLSHTHVLCRFSCHTTTIPSHLWPKTSPVLKAWFATRSHRGVPVPRCPLLI